MKFNTKKIIKILVVIFLVIVIFDIAVLFFRKKTSTPDNELASANVFTNGYNFNSGCTFSEFNSQVPITPKTCFSVNDIIFSDSGFYSSVVFTFENNKISGSFFLVRDAKKNILNAFSNDNFIHISDTSPKWSLARIDFPFLNLKENVVPYLNPYFLIKVLYLYNKVRFSPRLSDAARTQEDQLKYKRRRWSDVEVSPHLIGLAFDMSRYLFEEKRKVEDLSETLDLKYLNHGGRRNGHVHIQDQYLWESAKFTGKVLDIAIAQDSLVVGNFPKLKKIVTLPQIKFNPDSILRVNDNSIFLLNFDCERNSVLTIETINNLGFITSEISSGVFEKGNHEIGINYAFLQNGIYKIRVKLNNKQVKEMLFTVVN